jgi:sugar/nucleoside kinase (ribokinase family)
MRPVRLPLTIPNRAGRAFDVVGLGLNSVDLVGVVAEYPSRNSKQPLQQFSRQPGGQTATALTVCARLGWKSRYIGSFGDDELGQISRESLELEGVDISAARTVKGATNQFALVIVDRTTGERTVLWHRHPALAMQPEDVPQQAVTSGRLLIVDCHDTAAATAAAASARASSIPTILDVEKVRPGVERLLRHIDAIIAAQSFPSEFTGYESPGRALEALAREFNASLVCMTLGAEGSLARCQGREIRTPSFRVNSVDTTGAGDAFRGGFAAACLRAPDGEIEEVLRYANAVAALNCRAIGARGGMPTAAEVVELLAARARD